ncbi:hypothetical protein [Nocardioides deserti]|uniref:Ig-like domain-containing protein n=1 Tax=Nocardioides deserti TaxID=1588644 RepID=A0ABR6U7K6_9ACTN|nr:hypothetical protein [Nocardioides deserti]MBC2960138.1 hypothetical protein [Nocardioides deserti]GGO74812.1 hypothetical protein GCM10012276_23660 [Nocardioides deserti]
MSRSTDTWRRAVSLALAVLCFLAVPQVAQAVFNGQVKPGGTAVTVARMPPISDVTGSLKCEYSIFNLFREGASVSIDGITDGAQLPGTTYAVTLASDGSSTAQLPGKRGGTSISQPVDVGSTAYVVTVTASFRTWTTTWSSTIECDAGSNRRISL